jgi:hypothetical protein
MTTASRPGIVLALALMISACSAWAGTVCAATPQHIGSWVLECPGDAPGREPCRLRFDKHLVDKAGITGDLEIQALGKTLVPVITLRGLPNEALVAASLAGRTEASLQFDDSPPDALGCAPSSVGYVCSPEGEAAKKLAAGLSAAHSVKVRVSVTVTGMKPLPAQEKSLQLSGTTEALTRLRISGPTEVAGPLQAVASPSPGALIGMADKALKSAGYPNGIADLQTLLAKYRGK